MLSIGLVLILFNCSNQSTDTEVEDVEQNTNNELNPIELRQVQEGFDEYWNQGLAELTSYELVQGRYGEERSGKAVLIFVTEPFSRSKHVKLDNPGMSGEDQIDVLKLNFTRNFTTGIYPYSVMTSSFTPYRENPLRNTQKVTTSVQEWCGHVFVQAEKSVSGYDFNSYSYFESEGDESFELNNVMLEQELWSLVRIDPKSIPIGKIELVPSNEHLRFKHIETKSYTAEISIQESEEGLMSLLVNYMDIERKLVINFNEQFPHEIDSWEEEYRSGWGSGAEIITSSGKKIERRLMDYWNKNSTVYDSLRTEFGLE